MAGFALSVAPLGSGALYLGGFSSGLCADAGGAGTILPECAGIYEEIEPRDDSTLLERTRLLHNAWRAPAGSDLKVQDPNQWEAYAAWQAKKWSKATKRNVTSREWARGYLKSIASQAKEGRVGPEWSPGQGAAMRRALAPDAIPLPGGGLLGLGQEASEDTAAATVVVDDWMYTSPSAALSIGWKLAVVAVVLAGMAIGGAIWAQALWATEGTK